MADLWTFTLQSLAPAEAGGRTQYRFSGGATAITDQATGRVFALGPAFDRSTTRIVIGVQSDDLDVQIYPAPTDLLGGTPWAAAAWQGQLDGATVTLERAFMGAASGGWGDTSAGTVVLFVGRVSDLDVSRTRIGLKLRSPLELLNVQMPRRLWQPSCTHNFGDAMCGYDRVAGKNAEGTATGIGALTFACAAGSTTTQLNGVPATTAPFALGTVIGLDGANAGQRRTIAAYLSGVDLAVKLAFLSTPNVGDSFQILPGCDRTLATCGTIFRNTRVLAGGAGPGAGYDPTNAERFGGFPFIPPPENAI
jgi:hypothetical protein